MKTLFVDKKIKYDGSQLRSHYSYENFGLLGPSMIAFKGACSVKFEHMVDFEDKIEKATIASDEMLHFIVEFFNTDITSTVAFQRLLASQIKDYIIKNSKIKLNENNFYRSGDDLYFVKNNKKLKLSISIASNSAVSSMIHFAVNTKNSGTPVPTISLVELRVDEKMLAKDILKKFSSEYVSIIEATQKVKALN